MFERQLREAFRRELDPAPPLDGPALRARALRPMGWELWGLAAAALLALAVGVRMLPRCGAGDAAGGSGPTVADPAVDAAPQLRPRGVESPPLVRLLAVVDGAAALALESGSPVAAGASVVFVAEGGGDGFGCVDEAAADGTWTRVFPPSGQSWPLGGGRTHATLGGQLQAFRSDLGPGARGYRLLVDPADPSCGAPAAESRLELQWQP